MKNFQFNRRTIEEDEIDLTFDEYREKYNLPLAIQLMHWGKPLIGKETFRQIGFRPNKDRFQVLGTRAGD